jgi:hypothetical protein
MPEYATAFRKNLIGTQIPFKGHKTWVYVYEPETQ